MLLAPRCLNFSLLLSLNNIVTPHKTTKPLFYHVSQQRNPLPGNTSLCGVYRMISKHCLFIYTDVISIAISITGVYIDFLILYNMYNSDSVSKGIYLYI